ncbi:class I SAM-dependent methyltransferase [Luminiphilus sp.]|nr:class I SAM-dependent methyltransferase [Luminiphilus sp.]
MNDYFIKKGYKINEENITNDNVSDDKYWNAQRILAAEVYQFPVYQFLSRYVRKNNIRSIIDVGCGVGRKLTYVHAQNPTVEIIGIDQEDPIRYCEANYEFGEWYVDDFEQSTLSSDIRAELVICSDVIEHLINPTLLLNYIKGLLKKDGVVILSTPERDSLRGRNCMHSPNRHHVREWNVSEFELYLESSGFEVLDHQMQFPIKFKPNRIFYNEIVRRLIRGKPLRYNQVVVARVK